MNDRLVGFYRSEYQDNEGRTRHLATTQFEANGCPPGFPLLGRAGKEGEIFDVTLVFDDSSPRPSRTPP